MNMDLILGFAGVGGAALGCMTLGWAARIMWVEKRDDKKLQAAEARYERHTHRKGDALPTAGRIPLDRETGPELVPGEPPWLFAGESEQGWASESAEYELLTQTTEHCPDCGREEDYCVCGPGPEDYAAMGMTAELPVSVTGEPPIDTGELLAITDRVEAWIAGWAAQGNYDRHTMRAD